MGSRPAARMAFSGALVIGLFGAILLAACQPGAAPIDGAADPAKSADGIAAIDVAVTVAPQVWLVEEIGGDRVRVHVAVAPGESPETFQPSDAEASRLMAAKAYFRIGVPAEKGPWFEAITRSGRLRLVDLRVDPPGDDAVSSHSASDHAGHGHAGHGHGGGDPHSWVSPRQLRQQARRVADALAELDPAGRETYQERLAATDERLRALDGEIRGLLAPHVGRAFLIYHPAWGHFADEYGLQQLAVEIDGKTPSESELTQIQDLARKERCQALFVQPQISERIPHLVADALGIPLVTLDPLEPDVPANLLRAAQALAESFGNGAVEGQTVPSP